MPVAAASACKVGAPGGVIAQQAALAPAASVTRLVDTVIQRSPEARRDWVLKTSFYTLEQAIEDFAAQVDHEVIYEAREFPLDLKRDLTIARNAEFWEALRVLGETYRKSDGAFQILPTKFKQIVVVPMGQEAALGQR